MNSFAMTDTQRLAFNAMKGDGVNSKEALNQTIRESVLELCGGVWNYYSFMDNKYKVFAIISELMPSAMHASLGAKFDAFAEFKDVAMGDKAYFDVQDNTIYPVLTVARGIGAIDRQRIVDKNFTVACADISIRLYDEWDRFMAGKIEISRLVMTAANAIENDIGKKISDAIYGSYSAVGTDYKTTGSFAASTMNTIIGHVKAANGVDSVQLWGTDTALANVTDASAFGYSNSAKDKANGVGYWGEFRGNSMFALPQAHVAQSTTFAVSDNQIIILPASEKIVKVVFEGDTFVDQTAGTNRADLQMDFTMIRRVGVAAITAQEGKYGFWKFA